MMRAGKTFFITLASGIALCALIALIPNRPSPPPQATISYNKNRICPDAFKITENHEHDEINNFTVHLSEGCFGHLIHMPSAWHNWDYQPAANHDGWWAAFWWNGWPEGRGPFGPNDKPEFNPPTWWFRVQGHGDILFYSNDVVPGKQQEGATGSTEFHAETKPVSEVVPRNTDAHICDKPPEAYYARLGLLFEGGGEPPEFLFDALHEDNKINWAEGFKGTVPVCFLVNEKGDVSNITFPQAPPEHIKTHMIQSVSAWRFKGGYLRGRRDERTPASCQLAYDFTFR